MKNKKPILIFQIALVILFYVSCTDDKDVLLQGIDEEIIENNDDQENSVGDSLDQYSDSPDDGDGNGSSNEQGESTGGDGPYPYIDGSITIATWKNFSKGAISHTWDDAYKEQIEIAIPLYDSYGMHTTLFVLPNKIKDWEPYKRAYENGHEIASHTLTHPSLDDLDISRTEYELLSSKDIIMENMDFLDCHTLAYPYCQKDRFDLTQQHYIAARSCQGRVEKSTPDDFMGISSILCGQGSSKYTVDHLNDIAKTAKDQNGWGVYLFHLIDGNGGYTIDSGVLKQHLDYLHNNQNDYWVENFVNVVKYIKERNVSDIRIMGENSSQITISYTDNLQDDIYDFPVTFKKEVPSGWIDENIKVDQNSKECEFYVVEENENGILKKYVIFNAIPDAGEIVIKS